MNRATGEEIASSSRGSYFLAILCGFFNLDCLNLPGFRLGLLITKVPLP